MNKIKVGVLGASRGMDYINRLFTDYDYAEIYAICESYEILCKKAEAELVAQGKVVKCFTDFDDFIASGVEAVIICNYANKHCEYAIRALDKGIHVLSEVLPCETMAEAVALCDAVERNKAVYSYSENYCYLDNTFEMMRLYESGIIGEAALIEGDFINDCSHRWNLLTRGVRDHWRNYVPSTFYCTHSIAPIFYSTGLRAVRVNGFELPRLDYMAQVGARSGSAAMEVMELNNGGIGKSMNGNYRERYTAWYRIIGDKGSVSCDWNGEVTLYLDDGVKPIEQKSYKPEPYDFKYRPKNFSHPFANADALIVGFFIGAILGDEECKRRTIDVYRALDYSMPGLRAFRSIVDKGVPYTVPDMRDKEEREAFRNDHYSTNPAAPEEYRLPTSKTGTPEVDESVYQAVRDSFAGIDLTPGGK